MPSEDEGSNGNGGWKLYVGCSGSGSHKSFGIGIKKSFWNFIKTL